MTVACLTDDLMRDLPHLECCKCGRPAVLPHPPNRTIRRARLSQSRPLFCRRAISLSKLPAVGYRVTAQGSMVAHRPGSREPDRHQG